MPESFKESFLANLGSFSACVLADHEREVRRLGQIIEGLKKKIERHDGDKSDSDKSDASTSEDSSSAEVVQQSEGEMESICCNEIKDGFINTTRRKSTTFVLPVTKRLSNGIQDAFGAAFSNKRRHSAPFALTSLSQEVCVLHAPDSLNLPAANAHKFTCETAETSDTDNLDSSFRLAAAWRTGSKNSMNKKNHYLSKRTTSSLYFTSGDSDTSSATSLRISGFLTQIGIDAMTRMDKSHETCVTRYMQKLVVQPSSVKHVGWNMCGLLFVFYDAVVVPLEIFNPPDTVFFDVMLALSTVFWTLDIVGNFFTGYMRADGSVTMKPAAIALRYAFSWLLIDACLVACNWVALSCPDNSQEGGIDGLNSWRTLTLLRVLRILRLLKAPELEGFISEHIRSETTRLVANIARLIILLVMVAHFIACSWYGVGHYVTSQGNHMSWVAQYNLAQKGIWHNYSFSLHWSLSQFTGEQIIPLESVSERTFAIVIFIFAFLFSTIFVSSITTLMTRLQIIASKQSGQLCTLRRYLHDNGISTSLAVRIVRNAQVALRTNQRSVAEHSVELLQEISKSLQVELHFEVHFPTVSFHPFFKSYNAVNSAGMKKLCHQAVSVTWLSAQDIVFNECETPEKPGMLFVVQGELVYQKDGVRDCPKLYRGSWACEMLLWVVALQHAGTMSVVTESSLLRLEADKFQRIVRHFPTHHAREYARGFLLALQVMQKDQVTDIPDVDVDSLCEQTFPDLYEFTARQSTSSAWSVASSIRSGRWTGG